MVMHKLNELSHSVVYHSPFFLFTHNTLPAAATCNAEYTSSCVEHQYKAVQCCH